MEAGETGIVYQAASWHYLGEGRAHGRRREYFKPPEGTIVSERALRHRRMTKRQALQHGWRVVYGAAKHAYVWFEGTKSEQRKLHAALRPQVMPIRRDRSATSEPHRRQPYHERSIRPT